MTQQVQSALTPEVKAMIGVTGESVEAWGVVDAEYLRRFTQAVMDPDPRYWDAEFAKSTRYGEIIAPPIMVSYMASRIRPDQEDPITKAFQLNPMSDGIGAVERHGELPPIPTDLVRVLNAGNELEIYKYDVYRGPNIGIYTKVNDSFVFVPNGFAHTKATTLATYLKVEYLFTSVASTRLIGTMMAVNNHGMLLPSTCSEYEVQYLKKSTGLNVGVLDTKHNALGNLMCVNDKGGIISPKIPKEVLKNIQDILGIEVLQKKIAGYHQAGAMICANNIGGVIHPETDDDDIKSVSDVLKVKLEPATINGGIPYVSSGILANNKAVVVGNLTNGPEIMMLTRAFTN